MRMLSLTASFASLALLAACGSGSGAPTTSVSQPMEIRLIDAPTDAVSEIVVTLTRIDVHVAGSGWSTLVDKTQTVDLLKLQGGTYQTLGISAVPSGHITQFRLYTSEAGPNFVTTPDGAHHDLKVPSGEESGIKLKANFHVAPCAKGYITFDFDGKKSIFTHPLGAGAGDEWILRPVIRLHALVAVGTCDEQPPAKPPADKPDAGCDTKRPPTTPPVVPPAVTTPPVVPPPVTPPADTTPPPVTMPPLTPPAVTAPPVIPDPCAAVVCGGQTCMNGVCTVPIN